MSALLRKFIAEAIAADRKGNPAVSRNQLISPREGSENESGDKDEGSNEVDEISVAGSIAGSVVGPLGVPAGGLEGPGVRSRGKRRQSSARWK
jgi:hypothetical protein